MYKPFRISDFMISLVALVMLVSPAIGQNVEFESLLYQNEITCLLEVGDKVFGGLDGGGILVWNRLDPTIVTRVSAGDDLSGNQVEAMAWTGRNIWVATLGGGMTRVSNVGGELEFRKYAANIGSLDVTAVTGQLIGSSERVFYGMDNGGIGLITDGIGGAIYTAENDGLISDIINDLQIFSDVLFIATPVGISRFAGNVFTDLNDGLSNTDINELALDQNGNLVAAGADGVYRYDPDEETWTTLGWGGGEVVGLTSNETYLWALGDNGASSHVGYHDGSSWSNVSLPYPKTYAIDAGQDVWVGGRFVASGMASTSGLAWYGVYDGQAAFDDHVVDASLVFDAWGVTIDSEGRTWVGSNGGEAVSGILGDEFTNVYEVASVANDSTGLFNRWANIQSLASDSRGLVYFGSYGAGIVRRDNNTSEMDLMNQQTCGLPAGAYGATLVNLAVHPDGTLIVMYDWASPQKVAILTDPEHWRGDANWYDVPQGSEGLGAAVGVWDALVERNDVIWFIAEGLGLMRWDINGYGDGPDDEITWSDFSDDAWAGPITSVDGTPNNPADARGLALAPDGSIWYGGNGVTRFSYDENFGTVELQEAYGEKVSSNDQGLISGNVTDIAVDANGDLWASTWLGLNCVRWNTQNPEIIAYMDLANYFSNSLFSTIYSPDVISGLPPGRCKRVVCNDAGTRLALTSDQGAVAWSPAGRSVDEGEDLSSLYFYPNPWTVASAESRLKLGGIEADAVEDDPAKVEIFNLEGQLVYRNSYVSGDQGFWDGRNRVGNPVATGLYLMKTTWRGKIATRTLAVVR